MNFDEWIKRLNKRYEGLAKILASTAAQIEGTRTLGLQNQRNVKALAREIKHLLATVRSGDARRKGLES